MFGVAEPVSGTFQWRSWIQSKWQRKLIQANIIRSFDPGSSHIVDRVNIVNTKTLCKY